MCVWESKSIYLFCLCWSQGQLAARFLVFICMCLSYRGVYYYFLNPDWRCLSLFKVKKCHRVFVCLSCVHAHTSNMRIQLESDYQFHSCLLQFGLWKTPGYALPLLKCSCCETFWLWRLPAVSHFHWMRFKILTIFWVFPAVLPSIFQDPAVFRFLSSSLPASFHPPARFMCSFSHSTPPHLALSFCQSVYSLFQMCSLFVFSSKLPWLLFSCIRLFSCLCHSSFSVEFQ